MERRSFLIGAAAGITLSGLVFGAVGFDRLLTFAVDDAYARDEVLTLRQETLGLREVALPVVAGRTIPELSDLGASEVKFAFDGAHAAKFGPGRVYLQFEGDRVSDILTYCWRHEYLCSENGKS